MDAHVDDILEMVKPLEYSWKARVGSPGELAWELYQFLVGKGYAFSGSYERPKLDRTPIEGVATFGIRLEGRKDFRKRSWWRLIVGSILCITVLLIPVGWWLIKKSKRVLSNVVTVNIEGEAYRAHARTQDPHRAESDILELVSNARITLKGNVVVACGSGGKKPTKNESEWERMKAEFQGLRDDLDRLMPRITLPEAINPSK